MKDTKIWIKEGENDAREFSAAIKNQLPEQLHTGCLNIKWAK